MDFAQARMYQSKLGRFNTPDILTGIAALPQSLNKYSYVLNNPLNLTDSTGFSPFIDENTKEVTNNSGNKIGAGHFMGKNPGSPNIWTSRIEGKDNDETIKMPKPIADRVGSSLYEFQGLNVLGNDGLLQAQFAGLTTIILLSTREINYATFTRYFLTHLHINNRLHIDIQRSRFQLQAVA